jgi:hypothetical protein
MDMTKMAASLAYFNIRTECPEDAFVLSTCLTGMSSADAARLNLVKVWYKLRNCGDEAARDFLGDVCRTLDMEFLQLYLEYREEQPVDTFSLIGRLA